MGPIIYNYPVIYNYLLLSNSEKKKEVEAEM